jgi:multiple sugar transport system permease protein
MASRKFNKSVPYLLILPALAIIFPLLIYPVFYNVYLSFFSWKVLPPTFNFVKLQNYLDVFNNPVFWNSVKITLQFTGIVVGIQFVLGLGLAYLLNGQKFAKQTTRSIVLIPYISAPAIISLIWRLLWDPDLGQINQILRFFGIRGPGWIADPATSLFSVTVTEIWRGIPFVILVLLAGLQALPDEPYDAAKVDGASSVQIFFLITVPLLKTIIWIVLLFQTIFTLRAFDIIWVLTGGGPGGSTQTLSIMIYRTMFRFWDGGTSSTLSVIILILTLLISFVFFRYLYKEMEV